MTQEYEPIKLTESTPEPEDRGLYLIMESDSPVVVDSFWLDTNGFLYEGEAYSWSEILDIHADKHALYRLVSLAAHDVQIRTEALKLTDEQLDFAIKQMKGTLSKSRLIEREMLQQALTTIANDGNGKQQR
ncbi:hypothetical protein [Bifidobacterium crudilactis]|jgi:hypothetical protein|uniref:hypothetical protein n=1 Tax=Bifidobacterium crudilactis TaxID=327277 RepID=UPI002F359020